MPDIHESVAHLAKEGGDLLVFMAADGDSAALADRLGTVMGLVITLQADLDLPDAPGTFRGWAATELPAVPDQLPDGW